jgi:hypothetical protein
MAFADQPTEVLLALRSNLRRGLDLVAGHAAAGTLHAIPPGGSTPPAQSGWLTLVLLEQVEAELAARDLARVSVASHRTGVGSP